MEAASEFERPIIERIASRQVRDEAFRHAVQAVYESTCAMTGIKIINGQGRPEVQAAHIRPVSDRGPDSTRNGLALSGTVHLDVRSRSDFGWRSTGLPNFDIEKRPSRQCAKIVQRRHDASETGRRAFLACSQLH
jgi:hypothetical protein